MVTERKVTSLKPVKMFFSRNSQNIREKCFLFLYLMAVCDILVLHYTEQQKFLRYLTVINHTAKDNKSVIKVLV